MTSTCIENSPSQDLASFLKHNSSCDAQGRLRRTEESDRSEEDSPPPRPYRSTRTLNFIHADPRVTEDLLVVLKDSTGEEHARVERIEVHEIYL